MSWTDKLRESRASILQQFTQHKNINTVREGLKSITGKNMEFSICVITNCRSSDDDGKSMSQADAVASLNENDLKLDSRDIKIFVHKDSTPEIIPLNQESSVLYLNQQTSRSQEEVVKVSEKLVKSKTEGSTTKHKKSKLSCITIDRLVQADEIKETDNTPTPMGNLNLNDFTNSARSLDNRPKQINSDLNLQLQHATFEPLQTTRNDNGENGTKESQIISETHFLSPIKRRLGSNQMSDGDNHSTYSSQVSSFYLDKIDELIPEKKSVAEKLLRKQETVKDFENPVIETPAKPQKQPSQFRIPRQFVYSNKHASSFIKLKAELKMKLLNYRSEQEYKREQDKKTSAQALKYLRKLGRKIRKSQNVKFNFEQNNARMFNQQQPKNPFMDSARSPIEQTVSQVSQKISPRQALMQQQMQSKKVHEYLNSLSVNQNFSLNTPVNANFNPFNPFSSSQKEAQESQQSAQFGNLSQLPLPYFKADSMNPSFEAIGGNKSATKQNACIFDEMTRTVSFAPYAMNQQQESQNQYEAIDQLLSPVMARRDIDPDTLDEEEKEYIEICKEYKENDFYKDFKNYKDYYKDALLQNIRISEQQSDARNESPQASKNDQKLVKNIQSIYGAKNSFYKEQSQNEEIDKFFFEPETKNEKSQTKEVLKPSPKMTKQVSRQSLDLKLCKRQSKQLYENLMSLLEDDSLMPGKRPGNLSIVVQKSEEVQNGFGITKPNLIQQNSLDSQKLKDYTNTAKNSRVENLSPTIRLSTVHNPQYKLTKPAIKQVCKNLKDLYADLLTNKQQRKCQPSQYKEKKNVLQQQVQSQNFQQQQMYNFNDQQQQQQHNQQYNYDEKNYQANYKGERLLTNESCQSNKKGGKNLRVHY
ncbi:UNKNOWN [Stylonychia lemnae]|uniref:Uncharacterized protein n=1 Tax=Stylonychia lemnae TaxID=5949 RepID=A0A078B589_STYLE|nr:UNKNOWN [Stylonychia lemnae]|eukprot:CDW88703.1 UNKNOWN [Stylonychia lemnae]